MKIFALVMAVIVLAAAGCASRQLDINAVNIGMSYEEVVRVWGKPDSISVTSYSDKNYQVEWIYRVGGSHTFLFFENGILSTRLFSYDQENHLMKKIR